MSNLSLKKKVLTLKKKAEEVVKQVGLGAQKAKVASVYDISGSMKGLYRKGIVQETAERLLALAMNFDNDGAINNFVFGESGKYIGELGIDDIDGYVDSAIGKYLYEYNTLYAKALNAVIKHYYPNAMTMKKKGGLFSGKELVINPLGYAEKDPVYVIFLTDGNNNDKREATDLITKASHLPIFWQFIGIGNESFSYLKKLDDLAGRYIDNANFFQVTNFDKIGESELYAKLLGEFPQWLKEARGKGLIV